MNKNKDLIKKVKDENVEAKKELLNKSYNIISFYAQETYKQLINNYLEYSNKDKSLININDILNDYTNKAIELLDYYLDIDANADFSVYLSKSLKKYKDEYISDIINKIINNSNIINKEVEHYNIINIPYYKDNITKTMNDIYKLTHKYYLLSHDKIEKDIYEIIINKFSTLKLDSKYFVLVFFSNLRLIKNNYLIKLFTLIIK